NPERSAHRADRIGRDRIAPVESASPLIRALGSRLRGNDVCGEGLPSTGVTPAEAGAQVTSRRGAGRCLVVRSLPLLAQPKPRVLRASGATCWRERHRSIAKRTPLPGVL